VEAKFEDDVRHVLGQAAAEREAGDAMVCLFYIDRNCLCRQL
jgi:hypothetical protein